MGKIFKNMIPYWKSIILIVLLLIVQAFCDLSLPTYTADIIDVGIQNKGVEYTIPEKITEEEYAYAELFMTEEEQSSWEACYEQTEDGIYERTEEDKDTLDALDEELAVPLLLDYQMPMRFWISTGICISRHKTRSLLQMKMCSRLHLEKSRLR